MLQGHSKGHGQGEYDKFYLEQSGMNSKFMNDNAGQWDAIAEGGYATTGVYVSHSTSPQHQHGWLQGKPRDEAMKHESFLEINGTDNTNERRMKKTQRPPGSKTTNRQFSFE